MQQLKQNYQVTKKTLGIIILIMEAWPFIKDKWREIFFPSFGWKIVATWINYQLFNPN